jgi:hypothetical protein
MAIALVLGGASNVYEDIKAALALFTPNVIVAVKDIAITYPNVDHWVTYHPERLVKELSLRRKRGLTDPKAIWTYDANRVHPSINIPVKCTPHIGGSSGLMGMVVGCQVAGKAVLCGIPMDPKLKHFARPKPKGWPEAKFYRQAWLKHVPAYKHRVRSMSGWTREVFGAPTAAWLV